MYHKRKSTEHGIDTNECSMFNVRQWYSFVYNFTETVYIYT